MEQSGTGGSGARRVARTVMLAVRSDAPTAPAIKSDGTDKNARTASPKELLFTFASPDGARGALQGWFAGQQPIKRLLLIKLKSVYIFIISYFGGLSSVVSSLCAEKGQEAPWGS